MHGFSNVCSFIFSLGEFDPNIFPIPSWSLNSQDLPAEKHTAVCPDPALASSSDPMTADKDFFMALACLAARRSKDPHRQVNIHSLHVIVLHAVVDPMLYYKRTIMSCNFAGGNLHCQWGWTSCRCWI